MLFSFLQGGGEDEGNQHPEADSSRAGGHGRVAANNGIDASSRS